MTTTEDHAIVPAHGSDQKLAFLPPASERASVWDLAKAIQDTDFVPKSLQGKPAAIMAAMLTGRELGILPMRALRQVSVIEGRPTPSPELMMALALKAGHFIRVVETTNESCTVEVRRSDWPDDVEPSRLTWDLSDAERAGLCQIKDGKPHARSQKGNKLPWEQYPRAMLRSRAVSEACRAWLPDVVEGASYAPEELGGRVTEQGHGAEVVEMATSRGEDYDPLEGEPAEVREAVADAMGDGDVPVDEDGNEIADAEVVDGGYEDWSGDALKDECRKRDLKVSGNKPDLIARLARDDKNPLSPEDGAPEREEPSGGGGPTDKQRRHLFARLRDAGVSEEQRKAALRGAYHVESLNDLDEGQVAALINTLDDADGVERFKVTANEWLEAEADGRQAEVTEEPTEVAAPEPDPDPEPEPEEVPPGYDWQAHLSEVEVGKVDLIRGLHADWPKGWKVRKPSRTSDIDQLCESEEGAQLVHKVVLALAERSN